MTANRLSRALIALPLLLMVVLASCDLTTAGDREQIANVETINALTPSPTDTPTITNTPEATTTSTPTIGPSPTATNTPLPSATPLPPTPTPNPALSGFSFCDQQAGSTDGLFSARLAEAIASGTPAFEQVVLRFELGEGSGPLGARATCTATDNTVAMAGDPPYIVRISLPGWLRDDRFSASTVTETLSFTGTRTITGARLVPGTANAGADLVIGLSEPLPFRLSIERNPARVVIAVARNSPLVGSSDQLAVAAGGGRPDLAEPLFTILDGDIWRVEAGLKNAPAGITPGLAGATNLTESPETETHLAVSPARDLIAFCRAAPGLDPADAGLPVPSTLWVMNADGSNERPLGQVGVSCADPAFNLAGDTLAYAVDETGAAPVQRAIYTVAVADGQARRLGEGVDEWSRFAPQWLADDALVFAAAAQDGRSTLFRSSPDGTVEDIGAAVLIRDNAAAPYRAVGRPVAAPDGSRFAVEAFRSDDPGADLAVLDADGTLIEVIGAQLVLPPPPTPTLTPSPSATRTALPTRTVVITGTATITVTASATTTPTALPEATATPTITATLAPTAEPALPEQERREGPFWTRPLGWDAQGRLVYLSTLCASQVVQDYQVYRWSGAQRSELMTAGQTRGGIGQTTMVGDALAYVLTEQGPAGPRGPVAATPRGPVALWLWELESGVRGKLLAAARDLGTLEP